MKPNWKKILAIQYDYKSKETDNRRNGYSKKTVTSSMGNIDLDIPRDRDGEFEPQIVKKHQTDISNIEDQVLSMHAKGMTTRDITEHLQSVYGVEASPSMISKMTDLAYGKGMAEPPALPKVCSSLHGCCPLQC